MNDTVIPTAARLRACLVFLALTTTITAQDPNDVRVTWSPDYRTLTIEYRDKQIEFPRDMGKGTYPTPGAKPSFKFNKDWPVVTMRARWSIGVEGWPPSHRSQALDLMLMHACDAHLYTHVFPEFIKTSTFIGPPQFLKEATDPENFNLTDAMRGATAEYEITAKAGFGASDYKIRTKIRVGLSDDSKTMFYYDNPKFISDHLDRRQYVFVAQDVGDAIRFEVLMLCRSTPRWTFKGETMRRIEENGRYYIERIYENLNTTPTAQEIEDYLAMVKKAIRPVSTAP